MATEHTNYIKTFFVLLALFLCTSCRMGAWELANTLHSSGTSTRKSSC